MKTYLVSLPRAEDAVGLAGDLLDEGVLPEHLSLILDESYDERVTAMEPILPAERIDSDLVVERTNRDLRFATTGNPEMERSFKPALADPPPLFESEVGAGISTASANDDVSGVEEMDDAQAIAEEFLYPIGGRDIRTHGPNSLSELDPEAAAASTPGTDWSASATGIYGRDEGLSVGVFAALIPAVVPGIGVVSGDGPLAADLLAESTEAEKGLGPFLLQQGWPPDSARQAEACLALGGGLVEVPAASGEASARQIAEVIQRSGGRVIGERTAV